MEPTWQEKLLDVARSILTLRHGVISAITIIVVSTLSAIVLVAWLTGYPLYAFLLCFVLLVGVGGILFLALKAPELTALGGPNLPDARRMQQIDQLFSGRRGSRLISVDALKVQTDPTQLAPPKIELSEDPPEKD